jgi:glycosyltransferase involved in cell wall biosynthesis
MAPETPLIRVPVLVDVSRFADQKRANCEFYFLFCSSLDYLEVIEFVLAAFDNLCPPDKQVLLYLVVSGRPEQFREINRCISLCKNKAWIRLFKDLTDAELTTLYVGARALLIPLRATVQDMARFPHKIGEYLATGNPVITTRFGEVARYLTDGVNAVMANGHSVEEFTDKMRWVIDNPDLARRIGMEGQRVAMAQFEYRKYSQSLADFLVALLSGK